MRPETTDDRSRMVGMARDPAQPRKEGGWLPPTPGEENADRFEAAKERFTSADADFDDNELHAAGRTCTRCGREINAGEDVRMVSAGEYVHEACPMVPR
jgi:hypothetical protein